jgi:hypothetical protein
MMFVCGSATCIISHTLEEIAEEFIMLTKVLPALELLCLEHQPESSIHKYLTLRQDSGYPVTFVNTCEDFKRLCI